MNRFIVLIAFSTFYLAQSVHANCPQVGYIEAVLAQTRLFYKAQSLKDKYYDTKMAEINKFFKERSSEVQMSGNNVRNFFTMSTFKFLELKASVAFKKTKKMSENTAYDFQFSPQFESRFISTDDPIGNLNLVQGAKANDGSTLCTYTGTSKISAKELIVSFKIRFE